VLGEPVLSEAEGSVHRAPRICDLFDRPGENYQDKHLGLEPMEELRTLVIYDIEDDRIRLKVSETCLDYGLTRIQYSAFLGTLNRNKREELFLRLTSVLDDNAGKIFLQPICDKDVKDVLIKENEKPEEPDVL